MEEQNQKEREIPRWLVDVKILGKAIQKEGEDLKLEQRSQQIND